MKNLYAISICICLVLVHCELFDSQNRVIVKVDGIEAMRYSEILEILNIESSVDLSLVDLSSWVDILESNPRIQNVNIQKSSGIVLIQIDETKVAWLVQTAGKMYELDSGLKIISTDDIRTKWIPILSGSFKTNESEILGSSFLTLVQQANNMFTQFPELKERISEINLAKDGNIYIYLHHPSRMSVMMGVYLSNLQSKKLYSSVAYLEQTNASAQFLDLSGEDAFFY